MRRTRIAAVAAVLAAAVPALGAGDALAAGTTVFNFTGAPQTYTVPPGASYITATALGARGGNNTYSSIGLGAAVTANLPVTPGQTLYVYVGGHGVGANNGQSGGWNGGGNGSGYGYGGTGGGASDIRTVSGDLASRILVAGGGGGPGNSFSPAPGGNAGQDGSGGNPYGTPGTAGTENSGGSGGSSTVGGAPGIDGAFGQGGTAGNDPTAPLLLNSEIGAAGGGGGGGWYGGGGGGASSGGGGGSNHFAPDAWNTSEAVTSSSDGQVTITAKPASLTVSPASDDFGDVAVGTTAEHTFTATNTGDTPMTPTIAGGDGPYGYNTEAADACHDQALDPGQSCTYTFAFQPRPGSYGAEPGFMVIGEAASPETVTVNLTGTAVPVTPTGDDTVYNGQFNQDTPAIHVKGIDPDATAVDLYVDGTLDGTTSTVAADGTAVITPPTPLDDGEHTLTFRETAHGYDSPTSNDATVTVKTAPPTVDFPSEGQALTYRTPLLAVAGALSHLPVNYYLDGQLVGSEDSEYDAYGSFQPTDDLADGRHTLQVTTTDSNGQEGALSPTTTFTVDATAPEAPTVTSPADGSVSADATPDIQVTAEPGSRVHLLVDYNEDEGYQTADSAGHVTFTLAQPLADGEHQLVVFARDAANNPSAEHSSTFTLDTAAPAAPAVIGGPQGTTTDRTVNFEFSGEPGATFECSLDGGAFAPCTSPRAYTGLNPGEHTFQVRQTDTAGHLGATMTQTFTVATPGSGGNTTPAPHAHTLKLVVAKTGTVSRGRVPVGCRLDAGQLKSCSVTAYTGRVKVGSGTRVFAGGQLGSVAVKLTARGQRLVHRVGGVKLTYRGTAIPAAAKTLKAKSVSRVLPLSVAAVPTDGLFASGSAELNGYGKRFVRSLAGQLAGAKQVRCSGHTDSVGSAAMNQWLGMERAKTVCAQVRKYGVRAKLTVRSLGEGAPRASNRTAAGRALNRRVELKVRYR